MAKTKLWNGRRPVYGCDVAVCGAAGYSSPSHVRFSAPDEEITNFCKLLDSVELGCLNISASSDCLFDGGTEIPPRQHNISLQTPSVSLATVLASASLDKDSQKKLLLSYLLAKASCDLYDSNWMTDAWSKHEVQFMRQRREKLQNDVLLNHQPFLSSKFEHDMSPVEFNSSSTVEAPTRPSRQTHIFPKILALGIVLLEVELGESIENHYPEEFCHMDGRPRENATHMAAGVVINSDDWKNRKNIYEPVKRAIEICVKPDTGQLGTNPAYVREQLYRSVVAPLGQLFSMAYACDGCPEKFDPGPMKLRLDQVNSAWPTVASTGSGDEGGLYEASVPQPTVTGLPLVSPKEGLFDEVHKLEALSITEDCELFSDKWQEAPDPAKCKQASQWMYRFKELRVKHRIGTGRVKRIKVAILDTGIDMAHPDILSSTGRISDHKSFVGGDATTDRSGHGTHIAGILLNLTNNVDLYIAKFADVSRYNDSENTLVRDRILQALRHARLEWKVDMISLSFGFSKVSAPDLIQNEIEECLNNKIVVFAAASNDGGQRPRTYPGRYDRVLCIHSADGHGNGSSFSPTPENTSKGDNFSTVGECVQSYWPVGDSQAADKYRYMSGTSFATPVAVSIAALMMGYIQRKMTAYHWRTQPLSPGGIQRIFRMMARGNERNGYDWICPEWFFARYNEDKIQQDLIDELGGYKPKGTVEIV
ncbi:hypothetical protein FDECE_18415 [Fusarium decemcellulare]|nr:hypothetical protein FDECE_18415 [Fusarium decemcellulare]